MFQRKKKLYPIKRKNWGGRIALNITQLRKLKWCLSSNFGAPIANVRRFIRRKLIVSLYFINHCFGHFKIIQTKPYNIETNCKPRDGSGPAQLSFFKRPRQQLEEKPASSSVQSAVNLSSLSIELRLRLLDWFMHFASIERGLSPAGVFCFDQTLL